MNISNTTVVLVEMSRTKLARRTNVSPQKGSAFSASRLRHVGRCMCCLVPIIYIKTVGRERYALTVSFRFSLEISFPYNPTITHSSVRLSSGFRQSIHFCIISCLYPLILWLCRGPWLSRNVNSME